MKGAACVFVGREDRRCDLAHLILAERLLAAEGPHRAREAAGQLGAGDAGLGDVAGGGAVGH